MFFPYLLQRESCCTLQQCILDRSQFVIVACSNDKKNFSQYVHNYVADSLMLLYAATAKRHFAVYAYQLSARHCRMKRNFAVCTYVGILSPSLYATTAKTNCSVSTSWRKSMEKLLLS